MKTVRRAYMAYLEVLYKELDKHLDSHSENILTVTSYCKIDNFRCENVMNHGHMIVDPEPLHCKDVFTRLVRGVQKQKQFLEHYR